MGWDKEGRLGLCTFPIGGKKMDDQRVVEVMVASALVFKDLTGAVRHFLVLVDTVSGITDEIAYSAVRRLQHELGKSPTDAPRLLFGVELASILCDQNEKQVKVTSRVEKVLKQYAKVLTEIIIDNDGIRVGNYKTFSPFFKEEHELLLDIAQFIAASTCQDSVGTVNTLIRTIVARAPEEVLEMKIRQLELPDFCGDRRENRERFHEVFTAEYIKRLYGMWQVLMQLRHSQQVEMAARDDWEYCSSRLEEELWEMLRHNCEMTEPTSDQVLKRQLITSELMRRHHDDDTVKKWYKDNFPCLDTT